VRLYDRWRFNVHRWRGVRLQGRRPNLPQRGNNGFGSVKRAGNPRYLGFKRGARAGL
jgi:hypothetical protein